MCMSLFFLVSIDFQVKQNEFNYGKESNRMEMKQSQLQLKNLIYCIDRMETVK